MCTICQSKSMKSKELSEVNFLHLPCRSWPLHSDPQAWWEGPYLVNYSTSPRVHLSCIHFALFLFCSVPLAGFKLAIFLPVAPECRVTSRWTPSFLFFLLLLFICYAWHPWRSEDNLWASVFSFQHTGPAGQTQVVKLVASTFNLWVTLPGPHFVFKWKLF